MERRILLWDVKESEKKVLLEDLSYTWNALHKVRTNAIHKISELEAIGNTLKSTIG